MASTAGIFDFFQKSHYLVPYATNELSWYFWIAPLVDRGRRKGDKIRYLEFSIKL